jgi:hypothetical protein
MAEDLLKYADYFSIGMRVEVELPLAEGNLLRDEASIVFARKDLLELQLSRQINPESVILEIGTDLFLRTGERGKGYRCRAIFLRCDNPNRLHVRLAGEIIPFNEREFFRVDVYIPLSYHPYSVHGRKEIRHEDTDSTSEVTQGIENRAGIDADQKRPFPVAANLSGAGVRINIPERFGIDDLLELTLYLQYVDSKKISVLGQVVHVTELSQPGDSNPLFGTALRFISMDDTHHEILLRFIHKVQANQLKRLREESLRQSALAVESVSDPIFCRRRVQAIILLIISLLLFAGFFQYLDYYHHHKNKGEIERTFEEQIKIIIDKK